MSLSPKNPSETLSKEKFKFASVQGSKQESRRSSIDVPTKKGFVLRSKGPKPQEENPSESRTNIESPRRTAFQSYVSQVKKLSEVDDRTLFRNPEGQIKDLPMLFEDSKKLRSSMVKVSLNLSQHLERQRLSAAHGSILKFNHSRNGSGISNDAAKQRSGRLADKKEGILDKALISNEK